MCHCQNNDIRSLLTSPIDTTIRRHRREESTDTDIVMGDDVEFCNDIKVWSGDQQRQDICGVSSVGTTGWAAAGDLGWALAR